mmetsp:Transcript_41863/g.126950  ORF Transcript_41863/g.126950 Transcript_41863/m.126950 type:complete len:241 (+) Transcript_41863:163-885(+)
MYLCKASLSILRRTLLFFPYSNFSPSVVALIIALRSVPLALLRGFSLILKDFSNSSYLSMAWLRSTSSSLFFASARSTCSVMRTMLALSVWTSISFLFTSRFKSSRSFSVDGFLLSIISVNSSILVNAEVAMILAFLSSSSLSWSCRRRLSTSSIFDDNSASACWSSFSKAVRADDSFSSLCSTAAHWFLASRTRDSREATVSSVSSSVFSMDMSYIWIVASRDFDSATAEFLSSVICLI